MTELEELFAAMEKHEKPIVRPVDATVTSITMPTAKMCREHFTLLPCWRCVKEMAESLSIFHPVAIRTREDLQRAMDGRQLYETPADHASPGMRVFSAIDGTTLRYSVYVSDSTGHEVGCTTVSPCARCAKEKE